MLIICQNTIYSFWIKPNRFNQQFMHFLSTIFSLKIVHLLNPFNLL